MYVQLDFHVTLKLNQSWNNNQLEYLYPQNVDNDIVHTCAQHLSTKFLHSKKKKQTQND